MKINFDWKIFNPLYWHIKEAMENPDIREIFVMGGSSSGKTHGITQAIAIKTVEEGENHLCMRKFSVDIDDTIYADMQGITQKINKFHPLYKYKKRVVTTGKSKIQFRGLDRAERLQGISGFKRVYQDEITHFNLADKKQLRKRLRGKKGQQMLSSWNPISVNHWINKSIIKLEEWDTLPNEIEGNPHSKLYSDGTPAENSYKKINKRGNMLLIKTTYRDNWWIVGHPAGPEYGYLDKHVIEDFEHDKIHNPVDYDVYANGNWGIITERLAFKPSEWSIIDEIPAGAKQIPSGLDFGWNPDPTALVDYYILGNNLIWHERVYERELTNIKQLDDEGEQVGESLQDRLDKMKFSKEQIIVTESAEPKSIAELRGCGYSSFAVKKGRIIEGMKMLKSYHHLIVKGSENVIYEFENYQKKVDKDGNILEEYVDKDNHAMDGARYVQFMKDKLW